MQKHIKNYIVSKANSWSATTARSESARLFANIELINMEPSEAYSKLLAANMAPYSIKTLFIRIGELQLFIGVVATYKQFLKSHANLFKNAYQKERVNMGFEEARTRINSIRDSAVRQLALFILASGLRAHEALKFNKADKEVCGKGARTRRVFNTELAPEPGHGVTYDRLYVELRSVGLKPHTLRKLAATKLVSAGFREADLMQVMGWASMATASSYLQPANEEQLNQRMKEALHGT